MKMIEEWWNKNDNDNFVWTQIIKWIFDWIIYLYIILYVDTSTLIF